MGARARLYRSSEIIADSNWSSNSSSGTTFTFSLTANETTSNSIIELFGRDVENADENTSIGLTYSVANDGAEFGDCTTTDSGIVYDDEEESEAEEEADEEEVQESITQAVLGQDDEGEGGISEGWLPIMSFIALAVILIGGLHEANKMGLPAQIQLIFALSITIIGFITFVWLEWIPTWTVVIMVLLSATVLAFFFRDKIDGSSGGI